MCEFNKFKHQLKSIYLIPLTFKIPALFRIMVFLEITILTFRIFESTSRTFDIKCHVFVYSVFVLTYPTKKMTWSRLPVKISITHYFKGLRRDTCVTVISKTRWDFIEKWTVTVTAFFSSTKINIVIFVFIKIVIQNHTLS